VAHWGSLKSDLLSVAGGKGAIDHGLVEVAYYYYYLLDFYFIVICSATPALDFTAEDLGGP
jgi:hypothetical protein